MPFLPFRSILASGAQRFSPQGDCGETSGASLAGRALGEKAALCGHSKAESALRGGHRPHPSPRARLWDGEGASPPPPQTGTRWSPAEAGLGSPATAKQGSEFWRHEAWL